MLTKREDLLRRRRVSATILCGWMGRWGFGPSLWVAVTALAVGQSWAGTVYVSRDGNNQTAVRNDPSRKFRTVKAAADAAVANDTMLIYGGGEYPERIVLTKPLKIRSAQGWVRIGVTPTVPEDGTPEGDGSVDCQGNKAPVITGLDKELFVPWGDTNACAILPGVVTDDGLPNPPGKVTTKWGPNGGNVSIASTNLLNSAVCFREPGEYSLTLTASDGGPCGTSTNTLRVKVENRAMAFIRPATEFCGAQVVATRLVIVNTNANREIWVKARISTGSGQVGGPMWTTNIVTIPKNAVFRPMGCQSAEALDAGYSDSSKPPPFPTYSGSALQNEIGSGVAGSARLSLIPCGCQRTEDSHLDLELEGTPGVRYRIEASDDLRNWTTLTNALGGNGPIGIADPGAKSATRFYRAFEETESEPLQ